MPITSVCTIFVSFSSMCNNRLIVGFSQKLKFPSSKQWFKRDPRFQIKKPYCVGSLTFLSLFFFSLLEILNLIVFLIWFDNYFSRNRRFTLQENSLPCVTMHQYFSCGLMLNDVCFSCIVHDTIYHVPYKIKKDLPGCFMIQCRLCL